MNRGSAVRAGLALLLFGSLLSGVAGPGASPATAAVTPAPNPEIAEKCGVDLTLVLDASGSVQSSNAVNQVRDAAEAFLDALSNTGSSARVTQFATVAQQLAAKTLVDDSSLGPGGTLRNAIDGYYNPRPPRPSNVNFINTSGQVNNSANNNQYTNWDGSLNQAAETKPNLVVYVTDGDPTAYDLDQPGDPGDPGPPPDIRYGTNSSDAKTLDRAVTEANRVKATNNSRMLAVGVGNALGNSASQQRLQDISGPQVVRDADLATIDSLNDVDVALVTKFEDLAQFLRSVVLQLCSPSLTIQKLAQTAGSASYAPAPNWDMTVTPRVPGGNGFRWILPANGSGPSETVSTDSNGFAQFQWEPDPQEADSAAGVSEALRPGYVAGRPGANNDWSCDFKDEDGNVRTVTGELSSSDPANPSFDLDPIGQEIGTCKVYNSYDYKPQIAVTKSNSPTSVRGDLDPPAVVTSSYVVTNPGNTPLDNITVTDDKCGPVKPVPATGPNQGDTNGDGELDPGEQWRFTCDREARTSQGPPGGVTVVNTVDVQGTDPAGTVVTDDDQADATAFVPGIELTKQVNGQSAVTVNKGTEVTYTYRAENTGNTPLGSVDLGDDTPPCTNPTRGADDTGNNDDVLDLDETWTYSCTATPTQSVVNTATVTGTPLNPKDDNVPFAGRNPEVTDTDAASVTLVDPELTLTKTVDQDLVFPGTDVTYTYEATNDGDADLRNDTGDTGWVTDNKCTDVEQVLTGGDNTGDTNGDGLLNPGETWQFTCTTTIDELTLNRATIVAQPVDAQGEAVGDPLTRNAFALVEIVRPDISVTKTALVPVVLDPDATPVRGPDVPTPRPAEYTYDVSNTGTVPIRDVDLGDNRCDSPARTGGDTNGDDVLDVDEVWTYTCSTPLEREQATPPPGDESGLVTNTATVTGTPFLPDDPDTTGPEVTDKDTAQVLVIEPGISITKTASPTGVVAGDNVTYTFKVTNTGDVGLTDVNPVDDKCSPLERTGGDDGDDILEGANSRSPETWTYTCTRPIGLPPSPDTTDVNTVSVTGIDPLGNTYRDTDSAEVKVIAPAIHLEKSVSDSLVLSGSTVDYTFEVTNVGQSPLSADDVLDSVTLRDVTDPDNPACTAPVLVAKEGGNQDDFLDREPAETWRYTCQGTITQRTVDLAGVRAIGGSTIGAEIPVYDFATAQVTAFHPGIEVEKTASPTKLTAPGGDVTYTYKVRNTGDVPLADVADRITDDTCSPVTYKSGDKDGDKLLDTPKSIFEDALDETWVFTCTTFVGEDTTNTVVVEGTPVDADGNQLCGPDSDPATDPCDVNDSDKAKVVVNPAVAPDDETDGGPPPPTAVTSPSVSDLADTGAPPGLLQLLILGLGLLLTGSAVVAESERRRRRT